MLFGFGTLPDGGTAPLKLVKLTNVAPTMQWRHIDVELGYGTSGHLYIDVDKSRVVTSDGPPFSELSLVTEGSLTVGVEPLTNDASWKVIYDGVVCDMLP